MALHRMVHVGRGCSAKTVPECSPVPIRKRVVCCLHRDEFLPEGVGPLFPEHQPLTALREAMDRQTVLTGLALRCSSQGELAIDLGGYEGIIPREDAVHPAVSGAQREIAVLSRVGLPVSCTVTKIEVDGGGKPHLTLSRRAAQEQAMSWLLEYARPGVVLPARVTHLEHFGAFVDLGCGFTSLVPLERISAARISHPADRFAVGQDILVTVTAVDAPACRIYLSHKELLGTWLENAAGFAPGDTVTGIVRSIQDYGVFIELTPNLSGLAEWKQGLAPGDSVSVYIKSIRPESRKIKLQVIRRLGRARAPSPLRYFITDGTTENWVY